MFDKDKRLLLSYMTEQQRKDYRRKGYFWVIGQDRRVYQLSDGRSVWSFSEGRPYRSHHVYAYGYNTSIECSLLTQLLFLTSNVPDDLLNTGCGERTFTPNPEGCPRMHGLKALEA